MLSVALRLWEVAVAEGAGVTTQVAGWQKVHRAQKSQEERQSDQIENFSKATSLAVARFLF